MLFPFKIERSLSDVMPVSLPVFLQRLANLIMTRHSSRYVPQLNVPASIKVLPTVVLKLLNS